MGVKLGGSDRDGSVVAWRLQSGLTINRLCSDVIARVRLFID